MKVYPKPKDFDGAKFALRYGLSSFRGDYFVDAEGNLHVPDNLPDDPPIFEAPDSRVPPRNVLAELDELKARLTTLETKEIR
jgi:hypothetical protein